MIRICLNLFLISLTDPQLQALFISSVACLPILLRAVAMLTLYPFVCLDRLVFHKKLKTNPDDKYQSEILERFSGVNLRNKL